jgi:uncharacterized membrane protein YqhA
MVKFLTQLIEPGWWRRQMPALVTTVLGLLALVGVLYVTAVDARYLLGHVNQLAMPGLTDEMLTRLELEIAAEAVKLFLDAYLLVVILLIFAPGPYARFVSKRRNGGVEGVEFAAEMFLTRVGDLPKWLIGVTLLRVMIGYFQKLLRLEVERGLDLLYLTIVLLLVGSALFLSRRRATKG